MFKYIDFLFNNIFIYLFIYLYLKLRHRQSFQKMCNLN
jgi:hypothetical protein